MSVSKLCLIPLNTEVSQFLFLIPAIIVLIKSMSGQISFFFPTASILHNERTFIMKTQDVGNFNVDSLSSNICDTAPFYYACLLLFYLGFYLYMHKYVSI